MKKDQIRARLIRTLEISPPLKEILLSSGSVDEKRKRISLFLGDMLDAIFYDDETAPPLEWVLKRDAIRVLRSIFSPRSERRAGHSFLEYINDLLHRDDLKNLERPEQGFFAELEHLLKGLMGKTGIYPKTVPAFSRHEGKKAALLRSADLSRMARSARQIMDGYPCGLDHAVIKRRSKNKARILRYFNATELEWENWKWHTKHIIRSVDTLSKLIQLTEEEYEAVRLARAFKIPFGITPYYLSLMDYRAERVRDRAVRAQVIPSLNYVLQMKKLKDDQEHSMDFMLERDTSPIEGITRRYPMIVILKPILTCPQICVYCQRNWEIEDVYSPNAALGEKKTRESHPVDR